jgi:hypothetical protein
MFFYGYGKTSAYNNHPFQLFDSAAANGSGAWVDAGAKGNVYDQSRCGKSGFNVQSNPPNNNPTVTDAMGHLLPVGNKQFNDACSGYSLTFVGPAVAGVGVVVAAIGLYLAYGRSEHDDRHALSGRYKRAKFAIIPILSPDGGGATVRFDW